MTAATLPNISLTAGFVLGESGWSPAMNRNLRVLDALVNMQAINRTEISTPSASPGQVYIVGSGADGAWSGHDGELAIWCNGDDLTEGEWAFVAPREAWRVWVTAESAFYQYVSGAWVLDSSSSVTPNEYSTTIGDGSAANFYLSHGLGTRNVHVTVYRNATPWDSIVCDVTRPNENMVEISGFGSAPSIDEYVVLISK